MKIITTIKKYKKILYENIIRDIQSTIIINIINNQKEKIVLNNYYKPLFFLL